MTFDTALRSAGFRGGANLVAVSGLLRHASTRMTERYLHVTRADLRAAVEAGQPAPTATRTATEVETLMQHVESQGAGGDNQTSVNR